MRPSVLAASVLVLLALAAAGCGGGDPAAGPPASTGVTATSSAPSQSGSGSGSGTSPGAAPAADEELADMVERVLPSLVNVRVQLAGGGGLLEDILGGGGQGEGSGVVIAENGTILTNNHVVQDAESVTIVFADGRGELPGRVVGTAPERDLAVVCVDATGLDAVEIGSSGSLRLGDDAVALGYPLGLGGPTVTRGIISGLGRELAPLGGVPLRNLIQTDAAINPGNSGGPLVDIDGKLVGINTAGALAAFAENVGFAIAIDGAMPVVEEILAGGQGCGASGGGQEASPEESIPAEPPVETQPGETQPGEEPPAEEQPGEASSEPAWLGAAVADAGQGALLAEIVPGGPADEAGLVPGDVVTGIDGEPVGSAEDLVNAIASRQPGDRVTLELADGRTVEVELGRRPESS
jgi:S1-C subfamily serine protease